VPVPDKSLGHSGRIHNTRFPGTSFDYSLVVFSAQQTVVELFLNFVVAVEKWKAFCAFQAQRLFHGHPTSL
jgi:predicted NAD/FAD-dependent oxidoreductase